MAKVGRPLKFATPDELEAVIDAYFEVTPQEELTVTGLALALGSTRQVIDDYKARDDYREIVERAKLWIEKPSPKTANLYSAREIFMPAPFALGGAWVYGGKVKPASKLLSLYDHLVVSAYFPKLVLVEVIGDHAGS